MGESQLVLLIAIHRKFRLICNRQKGKRAKYTSAAMVQNVQKYRLRPCEVHQRLAGLFHANQGGRTNELTNECAKIIFQL